MVLMATEEAVADPQVSASWSVAGTNSSLAVFRSHRGAQPLVHAWASLGSPVVCDSNSRGSEPRAFQLAEGNRAGRLKTTQCSTKDERFVAVYGEDCEAFIARKIDRQAIECKGGNRNDVAVSIDDCATTDTACLAINGITKYVHGKSLRGEARRRGGRGGQDVRRRPCSCVQMRECAPVRRRGKNE
jgi:hypothetical protein